MKTAIEQLKEWIEENRVYAAESFCQSYEYMVSQDDLIAKLTELLPVEKEQHKETFLQGVITGRRRPNKDASYTPDFNHYFITQTYNDENNPKRSDSSNNFE